MLRRPPPAILLLIGIALGIGISAAAIFIPRSIDKQVSDKAVIAAYSVLHAANGYWIDHMAAAPDLSTLVAEGYLKEFPLNPYTGKPMHEVQCRIEPISVGASISLVATQADLKGNLVYLVADCSSNPRAQEWDPGLQSVFYLFLLEPDTPVNSINTIDNAYAWTSGYSHSKPNFSMSPMEFFLALVGYRITASEWPKVDKGQKVRDKPN